MTLLRKSQHVLLMFILFFSTGLFSQRPHLRFQNYTVEHGLAQSAAFCIIQDRKGFIWIATEQGLNRFDGYTFVIYKFQYGNPNCLSNSYVFSILEDRAGILWIGTNGGGLNRFDPDTQRFSHYYIDPESIDSMSNIVNIVYEDRQGELWVGTAGGGLKKFDRGKKIFIPVPAVSPGPARNTQNIINAIFEDSSGTLHIGTDEGLFHLDRVSNRLLPSGLSGKKNLAIFEDSTRILWVGTDNGFYNFNPGSGEYVHYIIPADEKNFPSTNTIRTFYEDHQGSLWLGTDYGLHIFNRRENKYYSYQEDAKDPGSLIGNDVRDIYEDRSGALWIGIYSGGISKLNRTEQSFVHYPGNPDGMLYGMVFAIYEDREEILWLGTYGEGLFTLDRKNGQSKNYRNKPGDPFTLSDNKIWAICEDRQGIIWIGTAGGGLNGFSRQTGKFTSYKHQPDNPNSLLNDTISTIIEDREGNLWIGTNGGLNKFDPQRQQFSYYKTKPNELNALAHNLVYIVLEDRWGLIWIGTHGGLSILNPKTETFTTFRIDSRTPGNFIHNLIFSMCEDSKGTMWLGTTGGLHKIDRQSGAISLYTEKDGLPNDVINGILDDNHGNIWVSTNRGISTFNPRTGKFKNYSIVDGLQDYEFCGGAYFKNPRGELFFGGLKGFNAFFPDSVKDNPFIPPVVITDFRIFNDPVPIGEKFRGRVILEKSITTTDAITLSHKDYIFSFEYAGLSYIHSEKNQYAYMMEGIEKSWNYVGRRRFVTYANLAPGDYVFRVKASNNHGLWSDPGVSLKITVTPPFWTSWWFRSALLFALLFAGLVIYWLRTRLILRRNRELEGMVERRTIALRESGEKYITVVERANSGIAIVQDEVIVFQNTPFLKLLGYDEKDIINRRLQHFIVPERQAEVMTLFGEFDNKNKLSGNFETILRHKDGQKIHVEINYGSITYKKRPALLMFFYDIRMQKLLEEERMRTAKLESTRVLAGGIAHDFNNLMAVILGNIELALTEINPGNDLCKILSDAERASLKAVDLLRQFITLSKGETPILKMVFIQDSVREAVQSVMEDSCVTVSLELPDDLWPIDCDLLQIKQALKNIIVNAKQAMPLDGKLNVKAENLQSEAEQIPNKTPGKYVCISIKDNGVGIPQEDLPKIFDPYFSTRDDVTQKGLGLGLTVVHSIIGRHEGTIQVTSEVGVGTTFMICFPISKAFQANEQP